MAHAWGLPSALLPRSIDGCLSSPLYTPRMVQPVPVAANERLETLDVLRGFALLGILAMNIRAMAAPFCA
jgi:hypothetical protein